MRQTRPSRPLPPRGELANVFEFEELARNVLPGEVFATVAGGDHAAFDRFTFRPRMMIPVLDMDLSVELFGAKHFTPILIGPVAEQREFHPDGELATVRGAAAARAAMVVSSHSSVPIDQLSAEAKTPLWYACYAMEADAPEHAKRAVAAGDRGEDLPGQDPPGDVLELEDVGELAAGRQGT